MIEEVSGKDELLEQDAGSPEAASAPDAAGNEAAPTPDDAPARETAADEAIAEDSAADEAGDEADDSAAPVEEEYEGHAEPIELVAELVAEEQLEFNWFILKVASNRENSIADALRRRVKVEGLDDYFGQIIVPVEEVQEFKSGKKKIVKRKLYPGYICVEMHVNDDTWFVVRDTPGIGDFTGAAGKPTPMLPHEVERILPKKPGEEGEGADKPKSVIKFKKEDRVRIKEGTFENFEGDVEAIDEANGRVTVVINIFDRPTPVEIDHWQLESV